VNVMVSIFTVILFFVYFWGLGFTAMYLLTDKTENALERFFLRVAIGMGVFPLLSIILNVVRIPLDWKIFLVVSIAFPLFVLGKKLYTKEHIFSEEKFQLKKSTLFFLLALGIAIAWFYIYTTGAFAYPYLEDEDPWGHAVGAKYVALEKTAFDPPHSVRNGKIDDLLSYIDPYPPAYDILMGVLHQTSTDLNWTLKFFNVLIICLGFVFFYMFARIITDRNKALFATFVLAAVPSYLTHFIWAHSLGITLFFPLMIAFEHLREQKNWVYPAGFIFGSIWVTQNVSQPLTLSIMLGIYLVVVSITNGKLFTYGFVALIAGFCASLLWWGVLILKYGLFTFLAYYKVGGGSQETAVEKTAAATSTLFGTVKNLLKTFFNPGGSGSRAYGVNDFFFAQHSNMINNAIGIGAVVSVLVLIAVVYLVVRYRKELVTSQHTWTAVMLFWLIYTFWGVNGSTFPISVARGAFRLWMFFSIPVALLAAEGLDALLKLPRKIPLQIYIIGLVVIGGVVLTSAHQKYSANTSIWPTSGAFTNNAEPFEYGAWFKTIEQNSKVFLYSPRDKLAIGYGAYSCVWCKELIEFREDILDKNAKELHDFMKGNDYDYFLVNAQMEYKHFKPRFGENKTQELLPQRYDEIVSSGLFVPVYQKENMFVVFRVV